MLLPLIARKRNDRQGDTQCKSRRNSAAPVSGRARSIRLRSRGECIASPQMGSPLHIEPEARAIAEHAGKNESVATTAIPSKHHPRPQRNPARRV